MASAIEDVAILNILRFSNEKMENIETGIIKHTHPSINSLEIGNPV